MAAVAANIALVLGGGACQTLPRYLVTASPIEVGAGAELCVGVDQGDPHGVWWWGPGASGCDSRSTGPGVFRGQDATISEAASGDATLIGFRLATHSVTRPYIDVRLTVGDGTMRVIQSGAQVALQRRADLDVPEIPVNRGR